MLETLVRQSIRFRFIYLGLLGAILALAVVAALKLPIDAIPDVSTIQVSVLTEAPGLSCLWLGPQVDRSGRSSRRCRLGWERSTNSWFDLSTTRRLSSDRYWTGRSSRVCEASRGSSR